MTPPMTGSWTTEQVIEVIRSLAREDDLPERLISGAINPQDTVDFPRHRFSGARF